MIIIKASLFALVLVILSLIAPSVLFYIDQEEKKEQIYLNEDHKIYCFTAEERWASYEHLKQENCIR